MFKLEIEKDDKNSSNRKLEFLTSLQNDLFHYCTKSITYCNTTFLKEKFNLVSNSADMRVAGLGGSFSYNPKQKINDALQKGLQYN